MAIEIASIGAVIIKLVIIEAVIIKPAIAESVVIILSMPTQVIIKLVMPIHVMPIPMAVTVPVFITILMVIIELGEPDPVMQLR